MDVEDSVFAAQVHRFRHNTAHRGAGAQLGCSFLSAQRSRQEG
jgi:hypothetical protein